MLTIMNIVYNVHCTLYTIVYYIHYVILHHVHSSSSLRDDNSMTMVVCCVMYYGYSIYSTCIMPIYRMS